MCLEADPNYRQLGLRPWVYEFSNSRRFIQVNPVYTGLYFNSLTITNTVFNGGIPSGSVIGEIDVVLSSSTFSGTLSLAGRDAANFAILGSNLITVGIVPYGHYEIVIIATQSDVAGSPISVVVELTGINIFSTNDIVTDRIFVPQAQPWHPASMVLAGRTPARGQPPEIRDSIFIVQEDGRPWHPSPLLMASLRGNIGVNPAARRFVYIAQEPPAQPNRSHLWSGNQRMGVQPAIANTTFITQEQPPPPTSITWRGQLYTIGIPGPVSPRALIVAQQYPLFQRTFTTGNQRQVGVSPYVAARISVAQEQPTPHRLTNLTVSGSAIGVSPESQAGTTVPTSNSFINASPTPGQSGFGNTITITSGQQVNVNGFTINATSSVTQLYYIGSTAFQFGSGAWYGPITPTNGGSNVPDPHPTIALSGTTVFGAAPSGTPVGTVSTTTGAGSYQWSYTLSGPDAASFRIVSGVLQTFGTTTGGSKSITINAANGGIIGSPFSQAFTIAVSAESQDGTTVPTNVSSINASPVVNAAGSGNVITIVGGQIAVNGTVVGGAAVSQLYYIGHNAFQFGSGNWYGPITASSTGTAVSPPYPTVRLSNNVIRTSQSAGAVVGAITTTVGAGTFTWAYSLGGPDAALFAISGGNLVTTQTLTGGPYSVTVIATNATVLNGPFSLPATITTTAESLDGTLVPTNGATINASPTAGTAGSGNVISIVGGQIAINGTVVGGAAVTQLYYIGSTAYQFGSGAWFGPIVAGSTGTAVSSPLARVALSSTNIPTGSPTGTVVGTLTITAGAGGPYASTGYTLSGADAAKFAVNASNQLVTVGALTGGPFALTVSATSTVVLNGPFIGSFSLSIGAAGVVWPTSGRDGSIHATDVTIATAANQPGNTMASTTNYNQYYNFGGTGSFGSVTADWSHWAQTDGVGTFSGSAPFECYQITICPMTGFKATRYGFDPADWLANRLGDMQALANDIAAKANSIVSVQPGWEWNSGGFNDIGFDASGQQTNYIQWFRTIAGYIKTACAAANKTVIITWAANSTLMHFGTLNDFYPGDDVVDAIGLECYAGTNTQNGAPSTSISLTDVNNSWGWLAVNSGGVTLGANHPAKATGSMTIAGVSTPIPTGGKKYIVIAEWQDNASSTDFITRAYNWASDPAIAGRVLVMNYWQSYSVGTGTPLTVTTVGGVNTFNTQAQKWIDANNNKAFPGLPVQKLS